MSKSDNSSASELKEWQVKWRCRLCKDEIYSRYGGEFVSCKCGAISVDQTPYYSRHIGDRNNFEMVKEDDKKTSEE